MYRHSIRVAMIAGVISPLATLVFAGTALAQPATQTAQTDQTAQSATGADQLQEVTVTAERVQTVESKTPVSIEVLSQSQLTANGAVSVATLAQTDPSINFDTGNGGGYISLRGINGSGGIGPAVPVAFDGFYYNSNFDFYSTLYDVGQLEVLRGPQGTLFGRNTSGGLIAVNSNNPTNVFSGYGELTLGSYDEVDSQGALNLPVNDKVQMRLAFSTAQHAGYRALLYNDEHADDEDAQSARFKIALEPTENLNILLTYQYTHLGGTGTVDDIFVLPADVNLFPTHVRIPLTRYESEHYQLAFQSVQDVSDHLALLHADYALPGGMTLSYLGGYSRQNSFHNTPFVGPDAAAYGVPDTLDFPSSSSPYTINQELRLASSQNQRVIYQTGLFYFHSWDTHPSTSVNDIGTPGAPPIVALGTGTDQNSYAWYGQIGINIGPTQLSLGGRETRDYVASTDLQSPGDGVFPALQSTSYSKFTWHAGYDWNVTDRNLLYAKVDTGYRAGAFNLNVPCNCTGGPPLPTTLEPYSPEYVTAYEIGSKNRFLNERMLFNIDAFYMLYNGEQLPQSNAGGVFTVNAAKTNIYGIESQFTALADPVGRFDLAFNWLHARFDSQTFCNALLICYNVGGNELLLSPSISMTAQFEHDWMVGNGMIAVRLQTKWQDGMYFDFYNFADSYQPGYTRTDAHLVYTASDDKWELDAWVRNIEDSLVLSDESESFSPPLIQHGTYNIDFQAPRTYGITFTAHF